MNLRLIQQTLQGNRRKVSTAAQSQNIVVMEEFRFVMHNSNPDATSENSSNRDTVLVVTILSSASTICAISVSSNNWVDGVHLSECEEGRWNASVLQEEWIAARILVNRQCKPGRILHLEYFFAESGNIQYEEEDTNHAV